jgi:dTDP-4-amino-4,6-dideoxygalactose transaminase
MDELIPFSPPRIDDRICEEVVKTLKSGWITTGPKTKLFEKQLAAYCGSPAVICLNSATAGLELMLRWFGVGEGDEVILPAYTYSATANVVMHCGAKPVFVDVNRQDFNISVAEVRKAITPRTKVIMPVDFAGMPCDYSELMQLAESSRAVFLASNNIQEKLGRVLVLSDSAHSFGAVYKGKKSGVLADVNVFSFHAVKNLTTAEGGAVSFNLPAPFDNQEVYRIMCVKSLHGQDKDALAKSQKGNWRYDIVEPGYKCNMTDIAAAIGIVELERYDDDTLKKRRALVKYYDGLFAADERFELPVHETSEKKSSCHLYPLRFRGISEDQRDKMIQLISARNVSVNVHFIPVPSMSYYRSIGYDLANYPQTLDNYSREITLPLFYNLTNSQQDRVAEAVKQALAAVC